MVRGVPFVFLLGLFAMNSVVATPLPGAEPFDAALQARIDAALTEKGEGFVPRTRHRGSDGRPRYSNRLLLERSPYLLQHAHNPVDWYPWGDEAFARARALGRPVFVSIGYSTCHWCHVMEEESFDDLETARLLNQHFIAIKVDRETRPDVDAVYMTAVQGMGLGGGWPLSVWLTANGDPLYGGTYFPPEDGGGRPGFRTVLTRIRDEYTVDGPALRERAGAFRQALAERLGATGAAGFERNPEPIEQAVAGYRSRYDPEWGGVGRGMKFPSSLPVRLLLRWHRRSGDADALSMATRTLERMAAGGLRDQLGGGFHRYSTDPRWLVPHFEKMLYDQALLVQAYLEGWQATGRQEFAQVARDTLDYVLREMTSDEGAFYSATDADSARPDGEMEEGRFFTWTPEEVDAVLGPEDGALSRAWWGVSEAGDLEGRSVLREWRSVSEVAAAHDLTPTALRARIPSWRSRLLAARAERPAPLRDDKVIAAWNGLMISAFARGALALDEPRYREAAVRAALFVLDRMRTEGRLHRIALAGEASGPAFLDDHAFVIAGLLDLYEAAPDPRWLEEAVALQTAQRAYADDIYGAWYRTPSGFEAPIAREKPLRDGAVPSGNAVSVLNLLRLATFTTDRAWQAEADLAFASFHGALEAAPTSVSELLLALDFALDPKMEILLVHGAGVDPEPLLGRLRRAFVPNRILAVVGEGKELERHAPLVPLLRHKKARSAGLTAYVCENQVCRLPTSDPETFERLLTATGS